MILTGKEIKDLAEYAGFKINNDLGFDEDMLDSEYTLINAKSISVEGFEPFPINLDISV